MRSFVFVSFRSSRSISFACCYYELVVTRRQGVVNMEEHEEFKLGSKFSSLEELELSVINYSKKKLC